MATITTGRTLDGDGEPIPETGFDYVPDGPLGEYVERRTGPITSHPTRPVWGIPLPAPSDDPETTRTLSVLGPGYDGPPEHYHERSEERFTVVDGEVEFLLDGEPQRAGPGESVVVETDRRHTFRTDDAEGLRLVEAEISSPGLLDDVLPTLGGLAHDDERDLSDPRQQAVVADRLAGNTTFTERDPRLTAAASRLLAPLSRLQGFRGAYDRYRRPAFWRDHVEQPD